MTKLTIVYTDGQQEQYNIIEPTNVPSAMTGMKRYKEIIEDDMLKLVIEGVQIVLIPIINIRKIIAHPANMDQLNVQDYPGFLNAKMVD
ncbi:hypothetical protein [Sulfurovum sp.]|uniref:hypothetical protein n=1 Tax=Sulfurovum sp. TaxID=1969726 RepID=UPI003565AC02